MSELNECPICMDIIGDNNCLTTECGHKFHTNCMFSNINHNGFICPCCRAQMIAENNDSDEIKSFNKEDKNIRILAYRMTPRASLGAKC